MDQGHRITLTRSFVADLRTDPASSALQRGPLGTNVGTDVVAPTSWQPGELVTAAQIDNPSISTMHTR